MEEKRESMWVGTPQEQRRVRSAKRNLFSSWVVSARGGGGEGCSEAFPLANSA